MIPSKPDWRALGLALLHLGVLWSFAFAQPLLDLLGDSPEFFVARGNTAADIVVLAVGVTLVPPLVLVGAEAVIAIFSERLRRAMHLVLVALLAAAFVLQLPKSGSGALVLALAVGLGMVAAALYARTRAVPMALTVLSPAPLVFLGLFLLVSPVSDLVLPGAKVETSRVDVPGDVPIVMIVFDELSAAALLGPDGKIDASRYPNFARLAGDATWYRNANTVADATERAVPALLSGDLGEQTAAPIASNYPHSLFTLLGGNYSFDVTEPLTDVCPAKLCPADVVIRLPMKTRLHQLASDLSVVSLHLLLPDDLEGGLPSVERSFGDFRALNGAEDPGAGLRGFAAVGALSDRKQQFNSFVRRLGHAPAKAHLSFLHVALPHNPYHFMPSGQRYPDLLGAPPGLEGGAPAGAWSKNRWLARQGFQRYLFQLTYSDRLLGEAMARLRSTGRYDRSLFVVVADHGVSFMPGDAFRDVTPGNVPQIATVPFFVKAPGQHSGRLNDANVRTADVLPTIAARLGIHLPWRVGGRSADARTAAGRIAVSPQHGDEPVTMDFDEFIRRRNALSSQIATDFGETPGALYRIGPDDDLLGRPVAALAAAPAPEADFALDGGGMLDDVDPTGPLVPSMLTGEVSGIPAKARLAVAVDGRVQAVTIPYEHDGVTRFAALVPPSSYTRGANSVELVAVTGSRSDRAFAALRGSQLRYRLVRAGDRTTIVAGHAQRIPVAAGPSPGVLEKLSLDAAEIKITGWAGTRDPGRAARLVLAFANGHFLGATRPDVARPDLRRLGPGLGRAGFTLAGARVGGNESQPIVHVYAILGRRAVELHQPQAP